jgi:diguanylate cyclase (GGDEF)-like protein
MQKDWPAFRITFLLYAIVVLIPVNYYFASRSFQSMENDANIIHQLGVLNGNMQRLVKLAHDEQRDDLVANIDSTFSELDERFIHNSLNREYVEMFRAEEGYTLLYGCWDSLKSEMQSSQERSLLVKRSEQCWDIASDLTLTAEKMAEYKSEKMLNTLFLTLVLTMLAVVALIYFVRIYMKIQINRQAIRDTLTGLFNRKYFMEAIEKAQQMSYRHESTLSLLYLDIDHFRKINEELGKKSGDRLLAAAADLFNGFFRQSDTVCRLEGDDFVVIVPDAGLESATQLAERLIAEIQKHDFMLKMPVTVSVGVAQYHKGVASAELLEYAKNASKRAYSEGGNRVVVAEKRKGE